MQVTRPYLSNDGSPGVPSYSLTVCHRPSAESTIALQYEYPNPNPLANAARGKVEALGKGEEDLVPAGVLTLAGARQLSEAQRLKARSP